MTSLLRRPSACRPFPFVLLAFGVLAPVTSGCAASIKRAAESATPEVVEGAVEEVEEKPTRQAVATILQDPDIREASADLSQALTEGVVRGVQDEVELAQIERLTEALVQSVGASLARSIARDVAPQISNAVGQVVDQSLERALSQQTEARLQQLVSSVTQATLMGAGEAVSTMAAEANPSIRQALARITHDAAYSGALGVDSAIRDAHAAQNTPTSAAPPGSLLAALGTLATWLPILPPVMMGGAALFGVALLGALIWALVLVRRQRKQLREQTARLQTYSRPEV